MIIVTGGAGMIGANLLQALNRRGYRDILVVDDLRDGRKFANLADAAIADYEDKECFFAMVEAGRSFGPVEAIFHQGACSTTTEWDGRMMMDDNFRASRLLLGYAQAARIPLIYASSAAVYGGSSSFGEAPGNERPLNVYAYSKKLFDDHVRARADPQGAPVVGLRYFNVYGPYEAHKGDMASVAFHLFSQVTAGKPARLFGAHDGVPAGEQSRDFIHAADVADVNLWAWEAGVRGLFNCGTGEARPFRVIAQSVIDAIGGGSIEYIDFPAHLVGRYQNFTQADITALRTAGYARPFLSAEEGVRRYVAWLQQRGAG